MLVWVAITLAAVLVLLFAELRHNTTLRWIAKPIAAIAFVGAGLANNAEQSAYGRAVLAALVLSLLGDVLLIPKNRTAFKGGILAFLLAHVAYVVAFFAHGTSLSIAALPLIVLIPAAVLVLKKLYTKVPESLRIPVLSYIVVISTMVAFAVGTQNPTIIAGAIIFYCSDLCVARERFLAPGFVNKLFGLPLYFGAQLIFAATIGSAP